MSEAMYNKLLKVCSKTWGNMMGATFTTMTPNATKTLFLTR